MQQLAPMAGAVMVVTSTAICRWALMRERLITKSDMTLLLVEFMGAWLLLLMLPRVGGHATMFWMGYFLVPAHTKTWVNEILEASAYTLLFCCALMCM